MKRTDIERRERELRRAMKKARVGTDSGDVVAIDTVSNAIKALYEQLEYDEYMVLNAHDENEELFDLLIEVKDAFPDEFSTITMKAVKRTKVQYAEQSAQHIVNMIEAM